MASRQGSLGSARGAPSGRLTPRSRCRTRRPGRSASASRSAADSPASSSSAAPRSSWLIVATSRRQARRLTLLPVLPVLFAAICSPVFGDFRQSTESRQGHVGRWPPLNARLSACILKGSVKRSVNGRKAPGTNRQVLALPVALEEPGGAYRAIVTYQERRPINNPQPMV